MEAIAFLDLAGELLQERDNEAALRASIGRSYFALHNLIVEFCNEQQITLPNNYAKHGKIKLYLQHCGILEISKIAPSLERLLKDRNDADYDMAMKRFKEPNVATLAYMRAKGAFHDFSSFVGTRKNRDKLKRGIKQYLDIFPSSTTLH